MTKNTYAEKITQFLEKFLSSLKNANDDYIEIFVNPDTPELRDIGPYIRFLIDMDHRKVYVADARLIIHADMASIINLRWDNSILAGEGYFDGHYVRVSRQSGGKLYVTSKPDSNWYNSRLFTEDLSWLKWYSIDLEDYLREKLPQRKDNI